MNNNGDTEDEYFPDSRACELILTICLALLLAVTVKDVLVIGIDAWATHLEFEGQEESLYLRGTICYA